LGYNPDLVSPTKFSLTLDEHPSIISFSKPLNFLKSLAKNYEIMQYKDVRLPFKKVELGIIDETIGILINGLSNNFKELDSISPKQIRIRSFPKKYGKVLMDPKVLEKLERFEERDISDYKTPEEYIQKRLKDSRLEQPRNNEGLRKRFLECIMRDLNIGGKYHSIEHYIKYNPSFEKDVWGCGRKEISLWLFGTEDRFRIDKLIKEHKV
jgi:hypothetical protein